MIKYEDFRDGVLKRTGEVAFYTAPWKMGDLLRFNNSFQILMARANNYFHWLEDRSNDLSKVRELIIEKNRVCMKHCINTWDYQILYENLT